MNTQATIWLTKNYRVLPELRPIKPEAYTPRMLSIGPLHRDKSELQRMTKEKRRFMSDFIDRLGEQYKGKNQNNSEYSTENSSQINGKDMCLEVITGLVEKVRDWFTEDIDLNELQLVEMLLLNGCFILELLYKYKNNSGDPLSSTLGTLRTLRNDLMLLENQIPLFVLKKLFDLIPQEKSIGVPKMSLEDYIFWFFNTVPMLQYNISDSKDGPYRHLLDVLHHACVGKKSPPVIFFDESHWGFRRCATELYKSGVPIVCHQNSAMVDIKFNEGKISIPQITIDKSSDTLLRNLIALEQVSCVGNFVSSYVKVMHSLLRSPEDADLLERLGIIIIKSDAETNAPDFFQSLCKGVVFGNFSFSELCKEVNEYHIPVWKWQRIKGFFRIRVVECKESIAQFKFSDFPSVFILQFLQTFYTVLAYYTSRNC